MTSLLALKTEGRRGSQRRLEAGGAIWVFPPNAAFSRDASSLVTMTASRSVSKKSGAVQEKGRVGAGIVAGDDAREHATGVVRTGDRFI
jgi:hypothetical protein